MAVSDFLVAISSGYIVAAIISVLAFFMVIYALPDESNRKCRSKLATACIVVIAGVIWPIVWMAAVKSTFKRNRNESET